MFGWHPVWNLHTAIEKTVEWTREYINCGDINRCMEKQINSYMEDFR